MSPSGNTERATPGITDVAYAWWATLRRQLHEHSLVIHGLSVDQTEMWEHLLRTERKIMTALDDLKAAVATEDSEIATLATTVSTGLADLQSKIASGGAITEADIEAVAATVTSHVTSLQGIGSQVAAADPGVPAPAPSPAPVPDPVVNPTPDPSAPTA